MPFNPVTLSNIVSSPTYTRVAVISAVVLAVATLFAAFLLLNKLLFKFDSINVLTNPLQGLYYLPLVILGSLLAIASGALIFKRIFFPPLEFRSTNNYRFNAESQHKYHNATRDKLDSTNHEYLFSHLYSVDQTESGREAKAEKQLACAIHSQKLNKGISKYNYGKIHVDTFDLNDTSARIFVHLEGSGWLPMQYCLENFTSSFKDAVRTNTNVFDTMTTTFVNLHEEIIRKRFFRGISALVILEWEDKFYIANAGKSSAVLVKKQADGSFRSYQLTEEPNSHSERFTRSLEGMGLSPNNELDLNETMASARGLGVRNLNPRPKITCITYEGETSITPQKAKLGYSSEDYLIVANDQLWNDCSLNDLSGRIKEMDDRKLDPKEIANRLGFSAKEPPTIIVIGPLSQPR